MQRSVKDTFESWLVGELLLVALLGSATALFLTNPILRNTYELPEGRLVLDTAVVLAATIVAILAGVRPLIEQFPLERAEEAFGKVMSNRVRFRAVLVP